MLGHNQVIAFDHPVAQCDVVRPGIVCQIARAFSAQTVDNIVVRAAGNRALELGQNRVVPVYAAVQRISSASEA